VRRARRNRPATAITTTRWIISVIIVAIDFFHIVTTTLPTFSLPAPAPAPAPSPAPTPAAACALLSHTPVLCPQLHTYSTNTHSPPSSPNCRSEPIVHAAAIALHSIALRFGPNRFTLRHWSFRITIHQQWSGGKASLVIPPVDLWQTTQSHCFRWSLNQIRCAHLVGPPRHLLKPQRALCPPVQASASNWRRIPRDLG
jgi:hypothetical protein